MSLTEEWRKSSKSGPGGDCVEVRRIGDTIEMRDTKLGEAGPILRSTPDEWVAFLGGVEDGEFDL